MPRLLDKGAVEETVRLSHELASQRAVAARLGISPNSVGRRLTNAGVHRGLDAEERARVVDVYAETGSMTEAARRVGKSTYRVRSTLVGEGIEIRHQSKRGKRLDKTLEEETVRLYEELGSLRAVGERLGISYEGVRVRLRNAGVERGHRLTARDRDRIVEVYRETESLVETSRRLRRSAATVRRVLVGHGVEIVRGHRLPPAGRWEQQLALHEEALRMARLYFRLGTGRAVADALGCSPMAVSKGLRLLDLAPGTGDFSPAFRRRKFVDRVVTVYGDGASVREAARQAGVSPSTAARWLREAGFDL